MTKVDQTKEELESHLKEQLDFLGTSASDFDEGREVEAKRMVVHIRMLLHDTVKSQSLLKLLGLKDKTSFFDSSSDASALGPYTGLVLKSVGSQGGKYVAPLDDFPPDHTYKKVSFDEYWSKDIFIDNKNNCFSRKKLILAIANKDGGAHIDPKLDRDYVEFTKQNSLGWIYGNGKESAPMEGAAFAATRQITHEILKTLIPDYPERKELNTHDSMVFGDIHLSKGFKPGVMVNTGQRQDEVPKVGRNKKCPCGSDTKYKKCHGKK